MPADGFPLPRLLNLPVEAESDRDAYVMPYHTADRHWYALSNGVPCSGIRTWNLISDGKPTQLADPFPHYECGTAARPVGVETFEGAWEDWDSLRKLSTDAIEGLKMGGFSSLTAKLPGCSDWVEKCLSYREDVESKQ